VRDEHHRGQQAGEREAVADLLHEGAGGAERRRCDERAAVDVHDDANGDVQRRHDRLAHDERLGVVVRVAHLRDDVEEGGGAGVGEDERREGCRRLCERRLAPELEVGFPWAELRRRGRAVLEADGDGEGDDCWGAWLVWGCW
jgi:hypothetical protein